MIEFDVDMNKLWGLFQAMGVKERVKLMKAAMRKAAGDIKTRAGDILIGKLDHVSNPAALKKTIWTKIYDRTPGFRVTVAGNAHCYPSRMKTRWGVRELPLGRWLEDGTGTRATQRGYARGQLPALKFLEQAHNETSDRTTDMLEERFVEQLMKVAKNYGCV